MSRRSEAQESSVETSTRSCCSSSDVAAGSLCMPYRIGQDGLGSNRGRGAAIPAGGDVRTRISVAAAVVAFTFVGMVSASVAQSRATRGSVSARVILPAKHLVAGSTMKATVQLRNTTGTPVSVIGCGSLFQVVLSNDKVTPALGWLGCAQTFTIPVGTSKFPVVVAGSYVSCGEGGPGPSCVAGRPPPLPPGHYQARLYQNPVVALTPSPTKVTVTRARS